jgi:Stress responsive A/B Barrel Domain
MLVHVVLMQLRPGISESALGELARRLGELVESVAGPDSHVVGANFTEEPLSQGFEFGFVLRFASQAQLDAYHVNPAHLPISLAIGDLARTVLVFDFAT